MATLPPSWSDLERARERDDAIVLERRSGSYRSSLGPAVEPEHQDQPRPQAQAKPAASPDGKPTPGGLSPAEEVARAQAWRKQNEIEGDIRRAKKRYVGAVCSCCCCCPQGCECVPGTGRPRNFSLSEVLLKLPNGAARSDDTGKISVLCCIPCCERDGPFVDMCDRAGQRCSCWCRACSAFAFLEVWNECCDAKRQRRHCTDAAQQQLKQGFKVGYM